MSVPHTVQVGPLAAAVSNGYAQSQAGTGGTALTLNGSLVTGGIGTPDTARRLIITSTGNDAGITFTITGRMALNGAIVTEVMQGTAGAATGSQGQAWSQLDYAQVISITPSGNTAANVTAGTNGVASSAWIRLDEYSYPPVALDVEVSGTVNYTIESAMRDPNGTLGNSQPVISAVTPPTPANLIWQPHPSLQSKTVNGFDNYTVVPRWVRLTLNSQTNPGFAVMVTAQPVNPLGI